MHWPELHYHCVHCGYSCQDLEVELSEQEFDRLNELYQDSPVECKEGRFWLKKNRVGCQLLAHDGTEGRCTLHRDFGLPAKPQACREFPFRAVETPDGPYIGASFACRAIATGQGPRVNAESYTVRPLSLPQTPLAPGLPFDWPYYLGWEARVYEQLRTKGEIGLWSVALEIGSELSGRAITAPSEAMEQGLSALFRGLLALAEGFSEEASLLAFLQAHEQQGCYHSRLTGKTVDLARLMRRWEEPWSFWPRAAPFFEHLLFRKFLLEGPDVYSRICSLPVFAQLLQYLLLARSHDAAAEEDFLWALRMLEERLTFHSRGLERYLGRFAALFLNGIR